MNSEQAPKRDKATPKLSEQPTIHPTAKTLDCEFGEWTEVAHDATVVESKMDDYSYVMQRSQIVWADIGKFCSIASDVRINPGNHPHWRASQHHFTYRASAYGLGDDDAEFFGWRKDHLVTIGHDVWIGHGATILPGRNIGTGAIIGAGAVVSHDVEPYQIVGGVPAKPIRFRFAPETITQMLDLAWWDWPREKIAECLPDMRILSAEDFIAKWSAKN